MLQAFVGQVSSHEGAEVPSEVKGVDLNHSAFWRELSSALGVANDHSTGLEEASDASSDLSDDLSESAHSSTDVSDSSRDPDLGPDGMCTNRQTSMAPQQQAGTDFALADLQEVARSAPGIAQRAKHSAEHLSHGLQNLSQHQTNANGVNNHSALSDGDDLGAETATDSDDSDYDSDGFSEAYDATLEEQLAESRVGNLLQPDSGQPGSQHSAGQSAGPEGNAEAPLHDNDADLKPVDLDTNLVQNLLQSYAAQEGLAGPAGNLAGLLGLKLPHNAE